MRLLFITSFLLCSFHLSGQPTDCQGQEQTLYDEAMVLYNADKTEQAITALREAIINTSNCPDSPVRGNMWHKLGVFHYILDQYDQAEVAYEQAIQIRSGLGPENKADLSRSYHNLGVALKEKNNYNAAIIALQQGMEMRRNLGENGAMADTYYELAAVYQQMGEYTLAINYLEATLPIFEEAYGALSYELGQSYNELGITHWKLQQYEEAHQALDQARAIFLEAYGPEDVDVARTFINSGNVFDDENKPAEALQQYAAALQIYDLAAPQSLIRAAVFNNQGVVLRKQKEWQKAEEALRQSLSLKAEVLGYAPHEEKAAVWDNIGDLHCDQSNYEEALQAYQQAILNRIPAFEDPNYLNNPQLKAQQIPGGWQPLLVVMISKARTLRMLYQENKDAGTLQAALESARLCDLIIDRLLQAFTTRQAKLFLRQQSSEAYEEGLLICELIYEANPEQQVLDEAFFFIEKSRAVLLAARLQDYSAQTFAGIPESLQKEEQSLRADIAYLENALIQLPESDENVARIEELQIQLASKQQAFTAFIQQLEKDYPRYYQQKYQLQLASSKQLDKYLGKNAAWISYLIGQKNAFALIRQDKTWRLIRLLDPETWQPQLQLLQTGLHQQRPVMPAEDFLANSSSLYKTLWAPLAEFTLPERIFLSPSGSLFALPFELLTSSTDAGNNWKKTNFLIHRYQFSYAYSASLLLNYQASAKNDSTLPYLGIAPEFSAQSQLPQLAYSQEEVSGIQALFGGNILIGQNANKRNFLSQAQDYRILHFSTHASTDAGGWIAFSGTQDSTARLYLNELYPLQLTADLAVLGACETGSGEVVSGEGVLSMAHAFAYAGCPSTVSSLWPVYHSTTTTILRGFYSYLYEGYSKDEALRMAKLDYLSSEDLDKVSAHPAYWAAFIHFGAPDALYTNNKAAILWGIAALLLLATFWWLWRRKN